MEEVTGGELKVAEGVAQGVLLGQEEFVNKQEAV